MTTVGTGKHTYIEVQDWARLPAGECFALVSPVTTDSQDWYMPSSVRTPRKDPPIVIFDHDRNHISSWGNAAFLYAHGIFIEDNIQDRSLPVKPGSVGKIKLRMSKHAVARALQHRI